MPGHASGTVLQRSNAAGRRSEEEWHCSLAGDGLASHETRFSPAVDRGRYNELEDLRGLLEQVFK